MRYFSNCLIGIVGGALVGALVGFGVEQVVSQSGWTLTVGALGANAGAFLGALRRAEDKPLWRVRGQV